MSSGRPPFTRSVPGTRAERRNQRQRRRRVQAALGAGLLAGTAVVAVVVAGEGGDTTATSRTLLMNEGTADPAQGADPAAGAPADPLPGTSAPADVTPTPSATPAADPTRTTSAPSARPTAERPAGGTGTGGTKSGGDGSRSKDGGQDGDKGGDKDKGSAGGSGTGGGGGSADDAEGTVISLVNDHRAAAGCGPLKADADLTRAARAYSATMRRAGVLSHTGPDGSTMTSRIEAAGYAWSGLGENIAQGQQDAAAVVDAWMHSPGHRANILNCKFTEIGVGVDRGSGGPWWTQDFGTPR
ncbi:CAP domain-containing protein [Streptomyces sp. NRRL S-87]|uniref:CAP domain-containing protein n=1 Tax=Streptomyces sp. NRRL S-87 TaxID=1463920 RepID=UPI0004C26FD4|nr:CAP domain-containing protein [Streptomyces sp. NRRL S-87]